MDEPSGSDDRNGQVLEPHGQGTVDAVSQSGVHKNRFPVNMSFVSASQYNAVARRGNRRSTLSRLVEMPELDRLTSIVRTGSAVYPLHPPYDPDFAPPEYPWQRPGSGEANHAYSGVRESLAALGMDSGRFGLPGWNPLGGIVKPGDTVLLKPNLVCGGRESRPEQWMQVVTHGSVVRALLDYVLIALKGSGRVVIADSPQTDSDFRVIAARTGLGEVARALAERSGVPVELLDLRSQRWIVTRGVCTGRVELTGDPLGVVRVDLGERSHFYGTPDLPPFYGAGYDTAETNLHHSLGRHVYEVSGTALAADVIVNIPKLKTHKKCGMTGCLKGMVGLAGNKNLLPHYRFGPPCRGGDQFPDGRRAGALENLMVRAAKRLLLRGGRRTGAILGAVKPLGYRIFGSTRNVVRSGNWPGNDTIWRTVLDLAAVMIYFDSSGKPCREPARRFFNLVDGIIGGEGNGPLDPDPVPSRIIIAGASPLLVDAVSAAAAGIDPMELRLLARGFDSPWGFAPCPPDVATTVLAREGDFVKGLRSIPSLETFRRHDAWVQGRSSR